MRIDSNQGGQTVSEGTQPATSSQTAAAGSSAAGAGLSVNLQEDQTQLSGTHALVQALVAEVALMPDVRQEKVSALRQAVQRGDYSPDLEQVAGALFSQLGASSPGAAGEMDWRASQEWAAAM
jgi:flagellar biosynthesis anti-sigma factor FlgM